MGDVEYPTRGVGFLDLARADDSLREAASLWIVDQVELYEDDARLADPRMVAARASLPWDRSFASFEEARALLAGPPLR